MSECYVMSEKIPGVLDTEIVIWYLHLIVVAVRVAYSHYLITHAQLSSGHKSLIFLFSLKLHPYFVFAGSEGSGETARPRRHARAFTARICDKYPYLMSWLMCMFYLLTCAFNWEKGRLEIQVKIG